MLSEKRVGVSITAALMCGPLLAACHSEAAEKDARAKAIRNAKSLSDELDALFAKQDADEDAAQPPQNAPRGATFDDDDFEHEPPQPKDPAPAVTDSDTSSTTTSSTTST